MRSLNHDELISIAIKDEEYYKLWIGDDLQELVQSYLGVRKWLKLRDLITILSRFAYFVVKTSPGEEFCQVLSTNPNPIKHLLMIALNNDLKLPSEIPRQYARLIKDVHRITFYLFGDFYEMAKRVTNYFYTTEANSLIRTKGYPRTLGLLLAFKMLVDVTTSRSEQGSNEKNIPSHKIVDSRQIDDPTSICNLCSEARTEPTSTLCGHIFCWSCIHQWLKERTECPICRTPTEPSRLVYLINFK